MSSTTNGDHGVVHALAVTLAIVSAAGVYADDPLPVYVRFTLTDERLKSFIADEQKAELESTTTKLVAKACSDHIKHRWRFVAAPDTVDDISPLLVVSLDDNLELVAEFVRPSGSSTVIWRDSLLGRGADAEEMPPLMTLPAKIKKKFSAALLRENSDDISDELYPHAPIALGNLVQIDSNELTAKIGLNSAELRSSSFDIECKWNLRDVWLGCHGIGFVSQLEVELQIWKFAGRKEPMKNHKVDLATVIPIRVYLNKFKEVGPTDLTTAEEGQ